MMSVAFWVGDRFTGHNFPVRVDFPLEGFDEDFLRANQRESFELPSDRVSYLADQM